MRFSVGLGKKVLIANYIALIADAVFGGDPSKLTVLTAWLGAISYMLQIYFDFSGYSDMAIGLGRMFGFRFSENFRYPYAASSVKDFWSRWHISLSGWFRDYVYIPLGGSRLGTAKTYRNMFVVWMLRGIWHGANWTFIVWGLYYFVLLAAEKRWGKTGAGSPLRRLITLFAVLVGWVLFRSPSLGAAGSYLKTMFGINGTAPDDLDIYLPEFQTDLTVSYLEAPAERGDFSLLYDMNYADPSIPLSDRDTYSIYFRGNCSHVTAENNLAQNETRLLIIGDSFDNVLVPFLSLSVRYVDVFDLRSGGYGQKFWQLIENQDYDCAVILTDSLRYAFE